MNLYKLHLILPQSAIQVAGFERDRFKKVHFSLALGFLTLIKFISVYYELISELSLSGKFRFITFFLVEIEPQTYNCVIRTVGFGDLDYWFTVSV